MRLQNILLGAALGGALQASAQASISLSNFQKLPPGTNYPLMCTIAYESTLNDCTVADFKAGASCNFFCMASILKVANTVKVSCPNVAVSANTLLGIIFLNNLLATLCPNNIPALTTSVRTTSTVPPLLVPASTPSTSTDAQLGFPSTTSSAIVVSSTAASPPLVPSTTATFSTSTTAPLLPADTGASSPVTPVTSTQAAVQSPGPALSPEQQQLGAQQNSGGGSPFDTNGPRRSDARERLGNGLGGLAGAVFVVAALVLAG